uniref:ARF7 effector protein C-terminal domain-containing protein n=1 Tax=Hyalomma excavatum TaxID=257692 RepID=A0A131XB82_9ACAR
MVTRCSIGLMRRSLCHMTADGFEESVRDFASLSYSTAKSLVSRLGRTFDNICTHHERVYLEGYGTPCFDPENKHINQASVGPKWLVPRRFSLVCRGRYPLRPGRTVCLKCLKTIRSKYPEIDAFYKDDEKEMRLKLEQLAESKQDDIKNEDMDDNTRSDGENSSQKEDGNNTGDEWKYDRLGRRRRNRNITTTERQLRNLRVENPEFSDVLSSLDIQSHRREKRRVTKKVKSFDAANYKARPQRHYNARGVHIASNKDACDCLQPNCPGCHFPCPKCGSQKCGDECRCSRNYIYDQIEVDGYTNAVFVNTL